MKSRILALILAAIAFAIPVRADNQSAPYAGQQARSIKSLSAEDVTALLKGEGMGMAKAAELNGYPGPIHVLTLASELGLTESQRRQVQAIFDRMSAAAKPLGAKWVEREQVLDGLFVRGEITAERLVAEIAVIGELQARLRSVHLGAHLETRALLNSDQIDRYLHLRGYADPLHLRRTIIMDKQIASPSLVSTLPVWFGYLPPVERSEAGSPSALRRVTSSRRFSASWS